MRVFVTGASGFVGSAVVTELVTAGHSVLGLARSDAAAEAVAAQGATALRGSLDDLESLQRGARESDGVVHCAFVHDFANYAASCATEHAAIEAFGVALEGSHKPLVVTAGTNSLLPGQVGTEADPGETAGPAGVRRRNEVLAIGLAARGIRAMSMRLPHSVHDVNDHGFVPALIAIAKKTGVSGYIGEGSNRWAAVHRLDAARAFRLALEKGVAGTRFHAIGDEGIHTRDIAAVIGRRLHLPVESRPAEDFGFLAAFYGVDAPVTAALTGRWLGWEPTHKGLLADLDSEAYFPS